MRIYLLLFTVLLLFSGCKTTKEYSKTEIEHISSIDTVITYPSDSLELNLVDFMLKVDSNYNDTVIVESNENLDLIVYRDSSTLKVKAIAKEKKKRVKLKKREYTAITKSKKERKPFNWRIILYIVIGVILILVITFIRS